MKLSDIVKQIQLILPKYTDKLSSIVTVSNIQVTGGNLATITIPTRHKLTTGEVVTISGVTNNTKINSVTKNGNLITFTTLTPHDLTEVWHQNIILSGFTDNTLNNTKLKLVQVVDRNTFVVQSTNILPILNGTEVLLEVRIDGINGRQQITVIDDTTFTISGSFINGVYSGGKISSKVRVAGSVTMERALEQYTEQNITDLWCFVVPSDISISKDRNAFSDAVATKTNSDDVRMKVIDGFTVTFVHNTSSEIAAVDAIDISRHDLLQPLLKTLFGARFPSGLAGSMDYKTMPVSSGISAYNRAILSYTYAFEVPYEIVNDDAVSLEDTKAFRNIDYINEIGTNDVQNMSIIGINLDQ